MSTLNYQKLLLIFITIVILIVKTNTLRLKPEYINYIKKRSFESDSQIVGPLTDDFHNYLISNDLEQYNFPRKDLGNIGSYGGKLTSSDIIINTPIVFVHGNSDGALSDGTKFGTGWTSSIKYFLSKGYQTSELYATTWGDRNPQNAWKRTHNCETIMRIRIFMEAVLDYTKFDQINVISHSMGVAIARKAIRGGLIDADDGLCDVGPSLRSKVNVFIGISGANYGMCQCSGGNSTAIYPTCNKKNGFWPGEPCETSDNVSTQELCGTLLKSCTTNSYSQLLQEMNENPINEAEYVFAYWSYADDLISYHDSVYGRPTSYIPYNNGSKVYMDMDHMQTKDKTTDVQYKLITLNSF